MQNIVYDIVIIGGGVAGLMAAGKAAGSGAKVLLLEKMEKPARKLRITGKGRCNITNTRTGADFLAKVNTGAEFVSYALNEFDSAATIEFLNSISLSTTIERGDRVFPSSGKAADVACALERWASDWGAEIRCNAEVASIEIEDKRVKSVTLTNGDTITCNAVIITTGGVSYPSTGCSGDGYNFAHQAGHNIIPVRPSLTPLIANVELKTLDKLQLKNVAIKLLVDDLIVGERFGDVDFYAENISGATVLQLSRLAVDAIIENHYVDLVIDLKPALSLEKLTNRINGEIEALPSAPLKVLLQRLTPSPLHPFLELPKSLKTPLSSITSSDVNAIATALKTLRFEIIDYAPFTNAIITAGGVDTTQCESTTMGSKLVSNLYFAGEVLDIDADTGGYNIQIALSTGRLAAISAAATINR